MENKCRKTNQQFGSREIKMVDDSRIKKFKRLTLQQRKQQQQKNSPNTREIWFGNHCTYPSLINYKLSEQDGWCSKSCRQRTLPNNPLFLYNVIHKLAKSLLLGMPKTSSQHTYTLYHKKTLMGLVYISHSGNVIVFLQCKHFIWSCRENIYCVACRKGKQTHLNRQIKRVLELITTIHYPLLYSLS